MNERNGVKIRCDGVEFSFGDMPMRFDFSVAQSEFLVVMGPSGSGKSTLLNLLAGFETPTAGSIFIGDRDVTRLAPANRPASMVFQENNLFAHLDVAANVGLGRSPSLKLSADDREAVSSALEKVGLGGKENRLPRELSGGERQRVALARVLVRDRPVLLLDEPFASLGPALRHDMLELLRTLHLERAMTVLLATHHPDDAKSIAERILFLENGQVAAQGTPTMFFSASGPDVFKHYIGTQN